MRNAMLMLLAFSGTICLNAQRTQFEIEHFDKNKPGPVKVFSANKLLGTTDSFGLLKLETAEWFSAIRLEQDGRNLNFELRDSSSPIVSGTRICKLRIVPETTEEAVVRATRAGEKEPHARTEVGKKEIESQNLGRDLPALLQYQPSVITTSDAGNGVGYTGIRVRGSDASRTNITVNGVPINDAESQGTFWVNMPDLASSVQQIQVQRGVGTSTNGAGAFGATVNIQTGTNFNPYGILANSFGSYGTRKTTLAAGTGLINNHWTMDMRLSQIQSDGYIDRAFSDLKSWYVSGGYFARKWSVKLLAFSGSEHTYQAWYGIPREKMYGTDSARDAHYYRNVGLIYRNASDSQNYFGSNKRTYNYYNYNNETDNYTQTHYHLYYNFRLNKKSSLNVTLYRTLGEGYFEQYRPGDNLSAYNLPPAVFGTDTITATDIVRRRWLDNTLTGVNANWLYNYKKISVIAGGGYSRYLGDHFGEIVWARVAPAANHLGKYYSATGEKNDGNIFVKTTIQVDPKLQVSLDLQLRRVYHTGHGFDNDRRPVQFKGDYLFFNPKIGVSRELGRGKLMYTSVSIGNKEPSRSDFTDKGQGPVPQPETLLDYEFGYSQRSKKYVAECNIFFMDYYNQLVLTGAVNDVGTPLRTNVNTSYRAGIELSGMYMLNARWNLRGNLTLSDNRIKEITIRTTDYSDYSVKDSVMQNVPISYSPGTIAALTLEFLPGKNWQLLWNHKYVGMQYLDNTGDKDKTLKPYYFSEFWVNKSLKFNSWELELKFQVLNLFNSFYNNNGYAWEYYYGAGNLTREVYLFPSAPRNYMGGVVLKF